jgi:regulator of ribonuclease activity A
MTAGGAFPGTADLCNAFPEKTEVCETPFLSYGPVRAFSGPVHTVEVHEDNVLVREALEDLPPGSVLVVDGGASRRCALLGDKLAATAASRGLAGVIVNGCVRDSRDLAGIEVGILAPGTNPRRSRKEGSARALRRAYLDARPPRPRRRGRDRRL